MGMWIELFVFGLVFVFALHQFNDLKKERLKREQKKAEEADGKPNPP
jgi:low temperature requirement protein LtrA